MSDNGQHTELDRNDESVLINLVINDYLLSGGEGYEVFKEAEVIMEYGYLLTMAAEAYFEYLTSIYVEVGSRVVESCEIN